MSNLIFFVTVTSLFAVFMVQAALPPSEFGPQIQALQGNLHSLCISQSGTDEASIANVINGVFIDEPKIKFYMKCLFTEAKVINEHGDFNGERITQLLPDKIKKESLVVINGCIAKINDIANLEDKTFSFFKCYHNENPNLFIFF
ncbi:general odorant-binding protein 83a-like [Anoplophora glabripennis]|uniref:general odorant-binding protein 83a-like n=1 Tax=Anoplophora glabripennis TaxID=217634 RepID=UPI000873EF03|nr:general odorant-binding protein 83a-like [Anoplophora glabripennis]